jgi:GAF domain-containing protein
MALALKVENQVIGVLDVQSDQPQAFGENDIAIMQILADQLATAIARTRLLEQVEQNLRDLEQAYGRFTREGWKTLSESGLLNKIGYRFDNIRIQPIAEVPTLGEEAMANGTLVSRRDEHASDKNFVAIPIKLRGQTIGVVSANLKDGYTQNTIATLELAIERLALSLESARLYEEARLRADREQRIAQIASNIGSATEFDSILRTTVEEVGRILGDTEVSIQIVTDSSE